MNKNSNLLLRTLEVLKENVVDLNEFEKKQGMQPSRICKLLPHIEECIEEVEKTLALDADTTPPIMWGHIGGNNDNTRRIRGYMIFHRDNSTLLDEEECSEALKTRRKEIETSSSEEELRKAEEYENSPDMREITEAFLRLGIKYIQEEEEKKNKNK